MRLSTLVLLLLVLHGCDNSSAPAAVTTQEAPAPVITAAPAVAETPIQFNIGNKSYLFDVSDHSLDELKALLKRAQEISQLDKNNYQDLEIVMILHGPDIDWFTEKNSAQNQDLIDLAAKLDAFDIIDMKVCETAMDSRGVKREEIPLFIESVPYAPDEMKRLTEAGSINL